MVWDEVMVLPTWQTPLADSATLFGVGLVPGWDGTRRDRVAGTSTCEVRS